MFYYRHMDFGAVVRYTDISVEKIDGSNGGQQNSHQTEMRKYKKMKYTVYTLRVVNTKCIQVHVIFVSCRHQKTKNYCGGGGLGRRRRHKSVKTRGKKIS